VSYNGQRALAFSVPFLFNFQQAYCIQLRQNQNNKNVKMKKYSHSSLNDPSNNGSNSNKIELLNCSSGAENCKKHLLVINECYTAANSFHLEKDYYNSIESLRNAFLMTCDLREDSCLQCANLFRTTIANSLENINLELHKLTTGFIPNKRYLKSYKKSCAVLDDIRREIKQIS
jgi:hypothetical protein